jgi:hypothetical protein
VQLLQTLDPADEWQARKALLRATVSPSLSSPSVDLGHDALVNETQH